MSSFGVDFFYGLFFDMRIIQLASLLWMPVAGACATAAAPACRSFLYWWPLVARTPVFYWTLPKNIQRASMCSGSGPMQSSWHFFGNCCATPRRSSLCHARRTDMVFCLRAGGSFSSPEPLWERKKSSFSGVVTKLVGMYPKIPALMVCDGYSLLEFSPQCIGQKPSMEGGLDDCQLDVKATCEGGPLHNQHSSWCLLTAGGLASSDSVAMWNSEKADADRFSKFRHYSQLVC